MKPELLAAMEAVVKAACALVKLDGVQPDKPGRYTIKQEYMERFYALKRAMKKYEEEKHKVS